MTTRARPFTTLTLKSLPPKQHKYFYWDTASARNQGRLGLAVYKSGEKAFYYRYYVGGKPKFIKLGHFPTVSLTEARTKTNSLKALVMEGRDPIAEEQERISAEKVAAAERRDQGTFGELVDNYIQHMRKEGKRTYKSVRADLEKEALSCITFDTPANAITPRDIAVILHKMIIRGAPVHSDRVRSYLHRAFNVAIQHDNDPALLHKPTRFNLARNPVSPIPRQGGDRIGQRALSEVELRNLLLATKGPGFSEEIGLLIQLAIFAGGQRPYELIAAKWKYVCFETPEFHLDETKNKRPVTLPLTKSLEEILKELQLHTGKRYNFFPKRNNAAEKMPTSSLARAISRYCERTGTFKFVPRDLRRTCKTLMIKHQIGDEAVLNRLHNHALNDVSNKHYNRYDYFDRKLEVLERWEGFLLHLLEEPCPRLTS